MAGEKSLTEKLAGFKKSVNRDFPIKKMILFGSRAKGKNGKEVDFDLMLVSEKFKKLNFIQRAAKMYNYWTLDYPADFLCYTPKEFEQKSKQITIVKEAIDQGITI